MSRAEYVRLKVEIERLRALVGRACFVIEGYEAEYDHLGRVKFNPRASALRGEVSE